MYIEIIDDKLSYQTEKKDLFIETIDYLLIGDINIRQSKIDKNKYKEIFSNDSFELFNSIFHGGFFICLINKNEKTIKVYRDIAGIKSGYYYIRDKKLYIGNLVHKIAKNSGCKRLNKYMTDMLLFMEFLPDGNTIYEDVLEFKKGVFIEYDFEGNVRNQTKNELNFATKNNNLSFQENVKQLRMKIIKAHEPLISSNNIVYLSGGLDSCVMLAALDEITAKSNISSISYRVKGTEQDETPYAQSVAKHLGIHNEIINIDPNNSNRYKNFEEEILKFNNPYIGLWIFAPKDEFGSSTYFAGQDTRLHTPAVNQLDKLLFNIYSIKYMQGLSKHFLYYISEMWLRFYFFTGLYNSSNKILKNSDRIFSSFDFEQYVKKYFFHLDERKDSLLFNHKINYNNFIKYYNIPLKNCRNARHIYNEIVKVKWQEQYTDDIKYIQDMARTNGTYIQMPFYDPQLSAFSSSIPFNFATKFKKGKSEFSDKSTTIKKIILRETFKDKLTDNTVNRKKAVSNTNFLLINGTLGQHIRKTLDMDLSKNSEKSFLKFNGYDQLFKNYIFKTKWEITDYSMILKLYYLSTLCIYHQHIN